jgi:hypothetical protein
MCKLGFKHNRSNFVDMYSDRSDRFSVGVVMTVPEYDKECDCDLCKQIRNETRIENRKRIKKEIENVLKEQKEHKTSTGTNMLEDSFR